MAEYLDELEQFDQELEENNFQGQWKAIKSEGKGTSLEPHVWKYTDVQAALERAKDVVSLEEQPQGARRSIGLRNPAFSSGNQTSWTINVGIQMVQPGEIARAHRHNITAFRFVIEGDGSAYTNVEGERFPMQSGDLILTPRMTWHDHANDADEPVVWLDGLDVPLIKSLHVAEFENFSDDQQPERKPSGYSRTQYGLLQPDPEAQAVASDEEIGAPPYRYLWEDTREALLTAADRGTDYDPYNGTRLEYANPETGEGPTLQTLAMFIQLLPTEETTDTHRHNSTEVYHVVQGSGHTTIDGEQFAWEAGDCFIVPPDAWHAHHAEDDETILFCVSDRPVLNAFGLHTQEAKTAESAVEAESAAPVSEEAD